MTNTLVSHAEKHGHREPGAGTPAWLFVVFPAIAVLLGWGLRGYIGGGPFGAMIPGCFLALSLSLLLNHDPATAGIVALFGTVGIACGGEMTYGQTLGLACDADTRSWGLLGVTLKGAIWGLLGGAMLGAGLTFRQYERRLLITASCATVLAAFIGWKLINEPQLIYFSDPVNSPRNESWAGLLFAAIAYLALLYRRGNRIQDGVPLKFALWGAAGGAVGFGGGTLFLVYGPSLPVPQQWFGWWKAMEFFFGLMLGGAFGACAYWNRSFLDPGVETSPSPERSPHAVMGIVLATALFFLLFPVIEALGAQEGGGVLPRIMNNLSHLLYTFVFLGAVCLCIGLYSLTAAWQVALTLTFFHTVVDFNKNAAGSDGANFVLPVQVVILLGATALMAAAVFLLQRRPHSIPRLYLLILWATYAMALLKGIDVKTRLFFHAASNEGLWESWMRHPSIIPVLVIFTLSALLTTGFILNYELRMRN